MSESDNVEIFFSRDGTQYKWDKSQDKVVNLTPEEMKLLRYKVTLMSDDDILNIRSGNGIAMGIPVQLNKNRLKELSRKLVSVTRSQPSIILSDHVIERLMMEYLEDYNLRGWLSEDDINCCILSVKRVCGIRLTVNHAHSLNADKIKYLNPHFTIEIQGKKENDEDGRLVLVLFDENQIRVVTIL